MATRENLNDRSIAARPNNISEAQHGIDDRLIELSIDLPSPMNTAKLPFQLIKIDDTTMFLAGHVPTDQNGNVAKPLGKVGDEVGPEEAYRIARQAALGLLATIKQTLGGLEVASWLHLFGMVNVAPGFNAIPPVINGASDLILEVFGPEDDRIRDRL